MPKPHLRRTALHWIGGQWVDSGQHNDSANPGTGEVIGRYADGGRKEAEHAVNAALRAFRHTDWKEDRALRARVLDRMAARFEARAHDLVDVVAAEVGKIVPHARIETAVALSALRYNAARALTDCGRMTEVEVGTLSMVIRQPVGVAGIIAPWNALVASAIRSLAPALAAGATVAMVLPRCTAQVNALIGEAISETEGLPPGVVNVLTGGVEAGEFLATSPDVPVISFTGSTMTGQTISAAGVRYLERFGLKLGGKPPMIVFEDADLDEAAAKLTEAITVFAGQFGMAGGRVLVQRRIASRFREVLARRLRNVKVGPVSDPTVEMGPLIDRANVARVNEMVDDAVAAGAKVIVRGGPATDGILALGAFYRPTLLEVVDSSLAIVQQEVFGPVLTLQIFDAELDAIALANESGYGLPAAIWSRDVERPLRVARALRSDTIWVNDLGVLHHELEDGECKQSEHARMRGVATIDDFLECKHIAFGRVKVAPRVVR
jgi:acyl-CoA reductase-like NAD-dependent aldehyde dehydrogenase